MHNIIGNVEAAIETAEQINETGTGTVFITAIFAVICVFSFIVYLYQLYRGIDKRIDERIEARVRPSIELLQDTIGVVKNLEKNTAEMNATLSILKELLITHKFLDK